MPSLTYFQQYLVLTGTLPRSPTHTMKTFPARLLSKITFSGNQFFKPIFLFSSEELNDIFQLCKELEAAVSKYFYDPHLFF